MVTPNIMYDLWATDDGTFMEDLRQLQDYRVINGGAARYHGATFIENPYLVLRNAGELSKQVGVTSPIHWGDGAPDPGDGGSGTQVDSIFYVGQSSDTVTHYVQCSDFDSAHYTAGDILTIHVARTDDYGITDGVDFLDGRSLDIEVVTVDATNNQLTFAEPVTLDYIASFRGTPNGGSEGTLYAYITKARDVHPVVVIGARGMCTFAARTGIRLHNPPDIADLPPHGNA